MHIFAPKRLIYACTHTPVVYACMYAHDFIIKTSTYTRAHITHTNINMDGLNATQKNNGHT